MINRTKTILNKGFLWIKIKREVSYGFLFNAITRQIDVQLRINPYLNKISLTLNIWFWWWRHIEVHQQISPKLLTMCSKHCDNTVNKIFNFDNMANNITTILLTIWSSLTILLPYMMIILLYNMVKTANIVGYSHHMVEQHCYHIIIIYDNNIVTILLFFTIL